jgi:hypothetical protein
MSPMCKSARPLESDFEMKKLSILLGLVCLLASCETANYVPSVTLQMGRATKQHHVDLVALRKGRTLFVHRCIECHTLPPLWRYSVEDWPEIVNSMSHRASLKPTERDAILAYIIAARASL